MPTKNWMLVSCAFLAILACDVEEAEVEAQNAVLEDSSAATTPRALTINKAITQNYCDHADRVLRAEVLKSRREADGDLARDRERAVLDGLRAGEAVFAGAERLLVRGADEVQVGFEDGWLVAQAPGVDAPLARLRLANGVKVHVLAHGVRKLVLTESLRRADIAHLIVLTDLDGAVTVDVEGAPSCLVIDGGGDAAAGPLQVNQTRGVITNAPNPAKGVVHGTNGDDHLSGTNGNDTMYGYFGLDWISAARGADSLFGNEDSDILKGGDDPASVNYGGKGNDFIYGWPDAYGNGRGYCSGGAGLDSCWACSTVEASCGAPFPAK